MNKKGGYLHLLGILRPKRKAQFQMSFSMLFSVFLIVVFIVVAFIAVKAFLPIGCSVETGNFINDLDLEINRMWKGVGEDVEKEFRVAGCNFEEICFFDTEGSYDPNNLYVKDIRIFTGDEGDHNLYFYPRRDANVPSTRLEHIDMSNFSRNPYCIKKIDDHITIRLSKQSNEALVSLS